MALFLYILAKEALASLPNALLVAQWPPFSIRHAQRVQAFLLKPAPFCKLFAGLGSTNKIATFPLKTLTLSYLCFPLLRPSVYPTCSSISTRTIPFSLPSLPPDHNEYQPTHFFWKITRPISWPRGVRWSSHPLPIVVSLR